MAVVIVCGLMLLVGVVITVAWGGARFETPTYDAPEVPAGWTIRLLFQRLMLLVGAVFLAGMPVAGAGGRLVMRLLAVTAGDGAQGAITEADQRVGVITTAGTISLITFSGALAGTVAGLVYLLLRRWLPPGRPGGLVVGMLLLIVFAPRFEPLRRDNFDFDLVGPGWLSLVTFSALAIVTGMATAAVINRLSSLVPLWERGWRSSLTYLPLLVLVPIGAIVGVGLLLVVPVAVLTAKTAPVVAAFRSERSILVGRIAIALVVLAALPRFVTTAIDIAGRG